MTSLMVCYVECSAMGLGTASLFAKSLYLHGTHIQIIKNLFDTFKKRKNSSIKHRPEHSSKTNSVSIWRCTYYLIYILYILSYLV